MTSADVIAEIRELRVQVQRMADLLQKREDRTSYQAQYYKRRKEAKAKAGFGDAKLLNRNGHCLCQSGRDRRLPHSKYAAKLQEFVDRGLSVYNFVTWLGWSWNHDTYVHVPITKSGGYMHVFIGFSGKKALRNKYSERDVTGKMRINTFTNPVQLDTFRDALWWQWTYATIVPLMGLLNETNEPWFAKLGVNNWINPLKIMMGGFGCYEVKGLTFDQGERDLKLASKAYAYVRPTLTMALNAWRKGILSKEEPFTFAKP